MRSQPRPQPRPPRLLVVEDDLASRHIIVRLVQQLGCEADTAENGAEAVRMLEQGTYDLVLMDVMMPEMDGLEATRIIRDRASAVLDHDVPIVAVTAIAATPGRDKCLAAGMNDFLPKPVRVKLLGEVIEMLVRGDDPREA
jgi:CheY-like chemotaxis protein